MIKINLKNKDFFHKTTKNVFNLCQFMLSCRPLWFFEFTIFTFKILHFMFITCLFIIFVFKFCNYITNLLNLFIFLMINIYKIFSPLKDVFLLQNVLIILFVAFLGAASVSNITVFIFLISSILFCSPSSSFSSEYCTVILYCILYRRNLLTLSV